jgi:hypothetical protein
MVNQAKSPETKNGVELVFHTIPLYFCGLNKGKRQIF